MTISRSLIACFFWTTLAGCAVIKPDWTADRVTSKPPLSLASPKLAAASVTLDVAFVSIRADQSLAESLVDRSNQPAVLPNTSTPVASRSPVEEMWRWIDETAITPEVRDALRLNGLRVGRVHTQSEFARALQAIRRTPADAATQLLDSAAVGSDSVQTSRRIPCILGKRHELPVNHPSSGDVATLVSLGGQTIGRTLNAPQPLFAITVQPHDASGVRVRMQPEIQFGAMRQTWVSSESALRIDNRRESWTMDELAFELASAAGDTIVAGSVLPSHGLGEQMFTGRTADGQVDHKLVVIRVTELPDMMARR